jgi:hypothetical protein
MLMTIRMWLDLIKEPRLFGCGKATYQPKGGYQ